MCSLPHQVAIYRLVLVIAGAVQVEQCHGSIVLNVTRGQISFAGNGSITITLSGRDSNLSRFEFAAVANQTVNYPTGYFLPDGMVSPAFNASGMDLRSFSLTIDGTDIPVSSDSLFGPASYIQVNGPEISLPSLVTTETVIAGTVDFNLEFNLFVPSEVGTINPTYKFATNGIGTVKLVATAVLTDGPPYFDISAGKYVLWAEMTCEQSANNPVPEPASVMAWAILVLSATCFRTCRLQ